MSGASSVSRSILPRWERAIFSASASSLRDEYRSSFTRRFQRCGRASAFARPGSVPVRAGAMLAALPSDATIRFRPLRRRMVSGTRTVMLLTVVMPRSSQGGCHRGRARE